MSEGQAPSSWFARLKQGLSRTTAAIGQGLGDLLTKRKLDSATLDDLEEVLIRADLGVETAGEIVKALKGGRFDKQIADEGLRVVLGAEIAKRLAPLAKPLAIDPAIKPFVVLVVGVNGSGKTTTIGKIAARLSAANKRVMIVAGDTFRAAAVAQVRIWAERAGVTLEAGEDGSDAAALVFDALTKAKDYDVVLIDTAGRLQNKAGLMAELDKIVRVIHKFDAQAPHACLLVLDATVGQNALSQAQIFGEVAGVTGLVMTKLDGTAKGGILVALARRFGLPIHMIGVGEAQDDLQDFNAQAFADALVGLEREGAA